MTPLAERSRAAIARLTEPWRTLMSWLRSRSSATSSSGPMIAGARCLVPGAPVRSVGEDRRQYFR